MYANRRTIVKAKPVDNETVKPFSENGRLNKGFVYAGNGKIKDTQGNEYLIADYK